MDGVAAWDVVTDAVAAAMRGAAAQPPALDVAALETDARVGAALAALGPPARAFLAQFLADSLLLPFVQTTCARFLLVCRAFPFSLFTPTCTT